MQTIKNTLNTAMIFAVCFSALACVNIDYEYGNKTIEEEIRNIPDFKSIALSASFDVFFEYSDSSEVQIVAESNLIQYIETVVINDELKLSTPSFINLRPNYTIEIYVKGPHIEALKNSSSGNIETPTLITTKMSYYVSGSGDIESSFAGDNLYVTITGSGNVSTQSVCTYCETKISGSGNLYINGSAQNTEYKMSGSGDAKAYDLDNLHTNISISGSGHVYTAASETLSATLSGSGNIFYINEPSLDVKKTGSGDLIKQTR